MTSAGTLANEFKAFILRGNVVDLAVGIVIGVAFGAVVNALVKDIITPIITIPGKVSFSNLTFTIGGGTFLYGDFINAVISFLIIAAAVFFFVVKPMNHLTALRKTEAPQAAPATRECPFCLSKVPAAATRCAFCTSEIAA
ncbi:MAG: mscL [Chloroflexi bacterium]|jgi:large conductance mechanosensitive channel|nr:mscL [Chloroflexota bacterium]